VSVSSVTAHAARLGVFIEVRFGKVCVGPRHAVTPELRAELQSIKGDLLRLLPDVGASPPPRGPRPALDAHYWDELSIATAPLTPVTDRLPCYACRGTRWWRREGSRTEWFCERCAPPMLGILKISRKPAERMPCVQEAAP